MKGVRRGELTISYSQFMLMNQDMTPPHVDWTDKDFERGYAEAGEQLYLKHYLIIRVK